MDEHRVEATQVDNTKLMEHLRLVHFSLVAFCLVCFLSVKTGEDSDFTQARRSITEILRLESCLSQVGLAQKDETLTDSIDPMWSRTIVKRRYANLLPSGSLEFSVKQSTGPLALSVTIPESARWYISNSDLPKKPLADWTIGEYALFWDRISGARLYTMNSVPTLVRGFVSGSDFAPATADVAGWQSLTAVQTGGVASWMWHSILTNAPDRQHTFESTKDDEAEDYSYIDWTSSGGSRANGAPQITVLKVYAPNQPVDLQGELASAARTSWKRGAFVFSFPELYDLTKAERSLTLSSISAEIDRQELAASDKLKVAGIELKAGTLGLWGGVVLLALQLYFLVHLIALRQRLTSSDKGWEFPWLLAYRTKATYACSLMTICALPVAAAAYVLRKASLSGCRSDLWFCKIQFSTIACLSLVLAVVTFLNIRISFRNNSPSSALF